MRLDKVAQWTASQFLLLEDNINVAIIADGNFIRRTEENLAFGESRK